MLASDPPMGLTDYAETSWSSNSSSSWYSISIPGEVIFPISLKKTMLFKNGCISANYCPILKIQYLAYSGLGPWSEWRHKDVARNVMRKCEVIDPDSMVTTLRWQPRKCLRLSGSIIQNVQGCLALSSKCLRLPGSVFKLEIWLFPWQPFGI